MLSVVLSDKQLKTMIISNSTCKINSLIADIISSLHQKWSLQSNKDDSVHVFNASFWQSKMSLSCVSLFLFWISFQNCKQHES